MEEVKENTPKRVISCDSDDYEYTSCVWGPLNKTLYIGTKEGKLFCKDVQSGKTIKEKYPHKSDIFRLHITHDFTMLMTASRDGTAKLLHPETFEEIRNFTYKKPVRGVAVSPLFDDSEHQKFHIICAGG